MPYEFKITRRVEFSDTDMEGIMHFSNFFRFIETAEHAFFRSFGHSVVLSRSGLDLCLPRVHAECDYFAPLHFEDEVLIHLLVERKGARSLTYQVRFVRVNGEELEVARARLVVVCAQRRDGKLKAVRLPEMIVRNIEEAPEHLLQPREKTVRDEPALPRTDYVERDERRVGSETRRGSRRSGTRAQAVPVPAGKDRA